MLYYRAERRSVEVLTPANGNELIGRGKVHILGKVEFGL